MNRGKLAGKLGNVAEKYSHCTVEMQPTLMYECSHRNGKRPNFERLDTRISD
jgi:hypothetical protein